ncbi:MAG: sodium-dependent transporter [Alphaproteobacteria bacterium]|nr:sodium-dependent transporter [Alphaproteobacteria bacterium]
MKNENFSKWGFILVAAGSAVGLGNIWRFPYLCGQYGGLSFILVYLLVLFLICNPLMVAEIALGRASHSNFVDAYKVIAHKVGLRRTWFWSLFGGWSAFIGVTMIISFYFLVAGWVLYYFFEAVSGKLMVITQENLATEFSSLTHNFSMQYSCGLIFLFATALVVVAGVKQGIEKTGLYLMPILFVMFLVLSFRAVTLEGANIGVDFLLHLDKRYWGVTENGFDWRILFDIITAALGQAFISLSLGFGVLLVYGSYLSPKDNLFAAVRRVEIFDTLAALLSAVIIIPAIFAAGLSADSGPGLTFISLPIVFQQLAGGKIWAICFYLLLMLATITSTISVFEALTNLFMDKLKLKRFGAVLMVLLISIIGVTMVTASFSGVWNIKILGRDIFTLFDWLSSTYFAAITSLTTALFVGYIAMKPIIHNIRRSAIVTENFMRYFLVALRVFAPFGLGLLLVLAFYK